MTSEQDESQPVRVRLLELGPDVEKAVKAGGFKSRSAFIRHAIRAYLDGGASTSDPAPIIAALEKQRQDLARVGANLNQIAHAVNIDGPAALDAGRLSRVHDELRKEFADLVETLIQVRHEQRRIR